MISFKEFCNSNNIKMDSLSNFNIINYMKKLKVKCFRNYFMHDELPKHIRSNECGVVNLQNSDQQGSHHVCYYKKRNEKYYFDSYGLNPSDDMIKYLKPTKNSSPIICSTFIIQDFNTVICGQLAIYLLFMLDQGHKFHDILLSLMDEIHGIKAGGDLNEDINLVHDVSLIT